MLVAKPECEKNVLVGLLLGNWSNTGCDKLGLLGCHFEKNTSIYGRTITVRFKSQVVSEQLKMKACPLRRSDQFGSGRVKRVLQHHSHCVLVVLLVLLLCICICVIVMVDAMTSLYCTVAT